MTHDTRTQYTQSAKQAFRMISSMSIGGGLSSIQLFCFCYTPIAWNDTNIMFKSDQKECHYPPQRKLRMKMEVRMNDRKVISSYSRFRIDWPESTVTVEIHTEWWLVTPRNGWFVYLVEHLSFHAIMKSSEGTVAVSNLIQLLCSIVSHKDERLMVTQKPSDLMIYVAFLSVITMVLRRRPNFFIVQDVRLSKKMSFCILLLR